MNSNIEKPYLAVIERKHYDLLPEAVRKYYKIKDAPLECKDYNVKPCETCVTIERERKLGYPRNPYKICWLQQLDTSWPHGGWFRRPRASAPIHRPIESRKEWFMSWAEWLRPHGPNEMIYLATVVKIKYPDLEKLLVLI